MNKFWTITIALVLFSSCIAMKSNDIEIKGKTSDGVVTSAFTATLTRASVVNDKIVLVGTNLEEVTDVRVTGPGGFNKTFSIDSKTSNQLSATALNAISFTVGQIFQVIISNALGQASFPVTFTLSPDSVSTSIIIDGEVNTADLANNSVTSSKIVDGGIVLADLASDSVNSSKIADSTIATIDLETGSVTSLKISDGTIALADMASNSVNSTTIVDDSIISSDISDGTISSADFAIGSVSSTSLADGSVALIDLAPNSVDTGKILDGTITAGDIADGAINSTKILNGSIANIDLGVDSIVSANITNGTVALADMAAASVGSAQVVDDSLTAADLGPSSVTSSEITDGTLQTDDYGNSTITSTKILDATITSDDLAADSVITAKILDNNITQAKLASSSVTSVKIASDAVTTTKIIDGAVDTNKILNNTILAVDLADMGASNGQFLQYNGTTWVGADLSGLNFKDSWDATNNLPALSDLGAGACPDLAGAVTCGDFYIVSNAGATSLDGITTWGIGDWVMATDSGWTEVNSSNLVDSVFGRTGPITAQPNDYTWAQINKAFSSLGDITDVVIAGVTDDQALLWDTGTSKFMPQDVMLKIGNQVLTSDIDTDAVETTDIKDGDVQTIDIADNAINSAKIADGIVGNIDLATDAVTASKILDETITDADISTTADIARGKLVAGSANEIIVNDGSGVLSSIATLDLARGGTGGTDAATARANLSAQTQGPRLDDIAGLAGTLDNFIVGSGTNFVLKDPTNARISLGLGNAAEKNDFQL